MKQGITASIEELYQKVKNGGGSQEDIDRLIEDVEELQQTCETLQDEIDAIEPGGDPDEVNYTAIQTNYDDTNPVLQFVFNTLNELSVSTYKENKDTNAEIETIWNKDSFVMSVPVKYYNSSSSSRVIPYRGVFKKFSEGGVNKYYHGILYPVPTVTFPDPQSLTLISSAVTVGGTSVFADVNISEQLTSINCKLQASNGTTNARRFFQIQCDWMCSTYLTYQQ